MMVKTLPVDVYRSARRGDYDCTNGGVSSKYNTLYLVCDEGWLEKDENDPQVVKLVVNHYGWIEGGKYLHCEPINDHNKKEIGYMMGGNFIYTSDSRFPSEYPIPIHDRSETQADYDALSQ